MLSSLPYYAVRLPRRRLPQHDPQTRTPFGRLLLFSAVALVCSSPIGAVKHTLLSLIRNITVGDNKHLKAGTESGSMPARVQFIYSGALTGFDRL